MRAIVLTAGCLLLTACDPNVALDRVTIAFTPQTQELEVALWFKPELHVPVGTQLQSIEPWGMLRLLPAPAHGGSASLTLRLRPVAADDPRILRMPRKSFTKLLPNGVSHGVGEELVELSDPVLGPLSRPDEPEAPRLVAYVDAYQDSRHWMGAAAVWSEEQSTPIPPKTTVWFPLKRDSQERVILSVAFYGAQSELSEERRGSVAAVFADYSELGRILGGGTVRRVETLRLGK